jgi:hypothetical protein
VTVEGCGTYAAYQRHIRRREPIDQSCRDANAAYMREYRAGNHGVYRREAAAMAARHRAQARLAAAHPREFSRLLLDEQMRVGLWRNVEAVS